MSEEIFIYSVDSIVGYVYGYGDGATTRLDDATARVGSPQEIKSITELGWGMTAPEQPASDFKWTGTAIAEKTGPEKDADLDAAYDAEVVEHQAAVTALNSGALSAFTV